MSSAAADQSPIGALVGVGTYQFLKPCERRKELATVG
jgi:hypothetical protein